LEKADELPKGKKVKLIPWNGKVGSKGGHVFKIRGKWYKAAKE